MSSLSDHVQPLASGIIAIQGVCVSPQNLLFIIKLKVSPDAMTQMLKIRLPDGSVREVAPGTTPADIAAAIGPGLAKAALAARADGALRDLNRTPVPDADLALVTARTEADALDVARHDYAHVLLKAVTG